MVERHPQRPEIAIVRLFANPTEYEQLQQEATVTGWEYEEYLLEVPYYDGLVADVNAAYEGWLAQAKAAEDAKDPMAKLMAAQDSTDTPCGGSRISPDFAGVGDDGGSRMMR